MDTRLIVMDAVTHLHYEQARVCGALRHQTPPRLRHTKVPPCMGAGGTFTLCGFASPIQQEGCTIVRHAIESTHTHIYEYICNRVLEEGSTIVRHAIES